MKMISQSNEFAFQLITSVALAQAASPTVLSSAFVDEVWYLFGYPDAVKQGVDAPFINKVVTATGGSSSVVNVLAAQRGVGMPLIGQQGVWVLARIPTLILPQGPVLDNNLINDGYNRFIYDVTSNVKIYSAFNNTQQLQIIQNGVVIFNANPIPGILTPLIPIQDNTNAYTPTGLHFDGATGLVTVTPLSTKNTGMISFAGWFNIDPSVTGSLQFSQGSGANRLFNSGAAAAGTWFHMIGTADAAANQMILLVNGRPASGNATLVGSVFTSAPTNGTNLYIGTDNQGNFFKGDIADLAIWFDTSFIVNGTLAPLVIGTVTLFDHKPSGITTITPCDPNTFIFGFNTLKTTQPFQVGVDNVLTITQPDIFISGPATNPLDAKSRWGTRIQNIISMKAVSGAVTNSSTSPGTITVVPT